MIGFVVGEPHEEVTRSAEELVGYGADHADLQRIGEDLIVIAGAEIDRPNELGSGVSKFGEEKTGEEERDPQTTRSAFRLPKPSVEYPMALGSVTHLPSITNMYSCRPRGKSMVMDQTPSATRNSGASQTFH
jgi:hypothetical protein